MQANLLIGAGIDEVLQRTDTATTSHFLTDGLGSTLALTDNAGTVQTEYTYEPFGNTTTSGAASGNPSQYTGRENDGTGLYYYRARYYHPGLQRFISQDPGGFRGGINLYAYVNNDPRNFRDPSGFLRIPWGGLFDAGGFFIDPSGAGSYYGGAIGGALGGVAGGSVGGLPGAIAGGIGGGFLGSTIGGLFDGPCAGQLNCGEPPILYPEPIPAHDPDPFYPEPLPAHPDPTPFDPEPLPIYPDPYYPDPGPPPAPGPDPFPGPPNRPCVA